MKPKNQAPITSENDAKEKLIIYVYEYLCNSGAKNAAGMFLEEINYDREIQSNPLDTTGFLASWWCVFWDLYCAAPEKKIPNQPEPSNDARAFHEFHRGAAGISPGSCGHNTSPPGPPNFMPGAGGGPMMGGGGPPRYGAPHPNHHARGGPMNVGPRMQNMIPQGGPPHPPPPQMIGPSHPPPQMIGPSHPPHAGPMLGSPRYGPHPGHMTPGSSGSNGPIGSEPGPSPGVNRMTPNHSGSPHPQHVGPTNGMCPMGGPPGGPHGGPPPHPPQVQPMGQVQGMQQRGAPPQNWQGNFNVNSPAEQQFIMSGPPVSSSQQADFGSMMMSDGGMMEVKGSNNNNGPPNQPQDDYVIPGAYGQQTEQSDDGTQIMKLKESLESNSSKEYSDGDQTGFGMDFPESQAKW